MNTQTDIERDAMMQEIHNGLISGKKYWICPVCSNIYESEIRPTPCPNESCHAWLLLQYKEEYI